MQNHVLWQGNIDHTFEVLDEWSEPTEVSARPVITSYWFGITVGFFYRKQFEFGFWYSSNITNLLNAWRVAQILPRVKQLKDRGGYDSTLCGLVIAMLHTKRENRHEERMRNRAKDLDISVDELHELYDQMSSLYPSADILEQIMHRMPDKQIDENSPAIRKAVEAGHIKDTAELMRILDDSALRLRSKQEQKEHEDDLIATGLAHLPEQSLKRLLMDMGVDNLLYTTGCGDIGEPSHFKFEDLDKELMGELIGKWGHMRWVRLLTSQKLPDDPTAHITENVGKGITMYVSDFGKIVHPNVCFGDDCWDMISVRFDRVTERFVVRLRPHGEEHDDQDQEMSISDIRASIGEAAGLTGPLPPGTPTPEFAEHSASKPQPSGEHRSWFRRRKR